MDRSQQLDQLKGAVKPFLRDYLESRGVQIQDTGHFLCINPKHPDKDTPSGHLVPDSGGTYWTCFGCGATGDIFSAAHWLEGLPMHGMEFYVENVQVLAARYQVPFEPIHLTEEDIYTMQLKQLYRHASDTLVEFQHNRGLVEKRGWSPSLCYDMRVGTVTSWPEFKTRLMNKGDYTVKFLEDSGIYESLFNPFVITFTLFDEYGNPIGFACRDSRWATGSPNIKKFRVTETRIPIFNKRELLYGLHLAKHRGIEVTIVEGYADVLTALDNGIHGFVALCTSSLTDEQVALLQKHGKSDLVLALDFDVKSRTGQEKTEKYIDEVLSGKKNLRVKVADLALTSSGESVDPDGYIKAQSDPRGAWKALPKLDAFEWRLGRMRGEPADLVCERMIDLILNEPRHAKMDDLLKKLADFTGVRLEMLEADLDARLFESDRRRRDEAKAINDDLMRKLKYHDPLKTHELFDAASGKVKALGRDTQAIVTVNTSIEMMEQVREKFLNKGEGLPGLRTNWPKYDERMGGLAKEDCFMVVGGIPSAGKTSFFCNLGWNIVNFNEDVCVLVYSVDDAISQIYPKFLSIDTGIPITWIAQPRRWIKDPPLMERLNMSWTKLKDFITSGKIEVRDSTFGNSVNYFESWIESKRKEYKGRHILAFMDNLHKVGEQGDGLRERFRNASEHLKAISQSGGVSVVVTAELAKATDRKNPNLRDLMETIQIEHDATIACLFHNDMQADPKTDIAWIDNNEPLPEDQKKPVVELRVAKNKNIDGAFKGTLLFDFDPKRSTFRERDGGSTGPTESSMAEPLSTSGQGLVQGTLIKP